MVSPIFWRGHPFAHNWHAHPTPTPAPLAPPVIYDRLGSPSRAWPRSSTAAAAWREPRRLQVGNTEASWRGWRLDARALCTICTLQTQDRDYPGLDPWGRNLQRLHPKTVAVSIASRSEKPGHCGGRGLRGLRLIALTRLSDCVLKSRSASRRPRRSD